MRMARKRIILLSDGTWQQLDQRIPTNIAKLKEMLQVSSTQLVFYDQGIGTGSFPDSIVGGIWGYGLDKNIKDLYKFLIENYTPGDEVLAFGFSRGAYTVRSLVGLTYVSGVPRKEYIGNIDAAYDLYRSGAGPKSKEATLFRDNYGERIPIECLVCFDTVGALGVPYDLPLGLGSLIGSQKYNFHDTRVNKLVKHAIHVMSVDEDRKRFDATKMKGTREGQVTQLFFPGGHSGVGGGAAGAEGFAGNTLRWVVEEMKRRNVDIEIDQCKVPEWTAPENVQGMEIGAIYKFMRWYGQRQERNIRSADECHESVFRRYIKKEDWRPKALERIKDAIEEIATRFDFG